MAACIICRGGLVPRCGGQGWRGQGGHNASLPLRCWTCDAPGGWAPARLRVRADTHHGAELGPSALGLECALARQALARNLVGRHGRRVARGAQAQRCSGRSTRHNGARGGSGRRREFRGAPRQSQPAPQQCWSGMQGTRRKQRGGLARHGPLQHGAPALRKRSMEAGRKSAASRPLLSCRSWHVCTPSAVSTRSITLPTPGTCAQGTRTFAQAPSCTYAHASTHLEWAVQACSSKHKSLSRSDAAPGNAGALAVASSLTSLIRGALPRAGGLTAPPCKQKRCTRTLRMGRVETKAMTSSRVEPSTKTPLGLLMSLHTCAPHAARRECHTAHKQQQRSPPVFAAALRSMRNRDKDHAQRSAAGLLAPAWLRPPLRCAPPHDHTFTQTPPRLCDLPGAAAPLPAPHDQVRRGTRYERPAFASTRTFASILFGATPQLHVSPPVSCCTCCRSCSATCARPSSAAAAVRARNAARACLLGR